MLKEDQKLAQKLEQGLPDRPPLQVNFTTPPMLTKQHHETRLDYMQKRSSSSASLEITVPNKAELFQANFG